MEQRNNKLRVVVIGAGMAGILAGIKLKAMNDVEFIIYEKADRVGGTWRENTYPGLTCDVPSHHYTFSFERNPDWTRYLPPGDEIQAYFERVTEKYELYPSIQFNNGVESAEFRDGQWQLVLSNGQHDRADVLIAATGVLHHPQMPNIPGMDRFQGAMFHTARWDHSVALEGKRVAVVGTGSTGVQIISALAGKAAHLQHYQRTAQWIMPVENGHYSEAQRAAFRADPRNIDEVLNLEVYNAGVQRYTQAIVDPDSDGAHEMAAICLQNLENSVQDPVLKEKLRPNHRALCKRLIFSPDYYQAIQHPQVELVTEGIECIEAQGIRTRDGQLHELDVIALATGFKADRFMRPMQIRGLNGTELESLWAVRPRALLAISMPDMPNLFMLNGPNGPVGNFSLIDIAEHQWGYIEQMINRLRRGECRQISPRWEALDRFDQERIAAAKTTIWATGGCNSWYLDGEGIPASWPWDYNRFASAMSQPQWEDYLIA